MVYEEIECRTALTALERGIEHPNLGRRRKELKIFICCLEIVPFALLLKCHLLVENKV